MALNEYRLRLALRRALYRCSWYDVRVCINPNWHRKEFYYHQASKRFVCAICERLESQVA